MYVICSGCFAVYKKKHENEIDKNKKPEDDVEKDDNFMFITEIGRGKIITF